MTLPFTYLGTPPYQMKTPTEIVSLELINSWDSLRQSNNPRQVAAASLMQLSALALRDCCIRPDEPEVFRKRMRLIENMARDAAS